MDINSLFDVRDKVVLVTGGSRGIGLMIAQGFVNNGARVYISSRKAQICDAVAAELSKQGPGQCFSIPADLQSLKDTQRLATELAKHEKVLDVLVNNAGANWAAPVESYTDEAFQKVMNLNLNRVFTLTQACLPLLEAAASDGSPARVINIGSIDGLRTPSHQTFAYSASKAALHHLTRVLANDFGPRRITVNSVAPGPFESKMMEATLANFQDAIVASCPLERIGRPSDMAGVCLFLASKAGSFVNGTTIPVDGGIIVKAAL